MKSSSLCLRLQKQRYRVYAQSKTDNRIEVTELRAFVVIAFDASCTKPVFLLASHTCGAMSY
jgi:hypothetical protein